jgi:hypothetical protein
MTIPSITPRRLSRVVNGSLLSGLLATGAIALTGGGAASPAQAAPPPDGPRTYEVTADLDGRATPSRKGHVAAVNFLHNKERVSVECQEHGGSAYGSRLWDLVSRDGMTLYVPDRFIKTGTSGRAPDIRACDSDDRPDTDPGPDGDPNS